MNDSLLVSCGREWFNRRVAGAWFVHEGEVLQIQRAGERTIVCCNTKGGRVELPHTVIPGFKAFAYAKLGYRRDTKTGAVGFLTRHHTYNRGLRPQDVHVETTPGYVSIQREFQVHRRDYGEFMDVVLKPKFDDVETVNEVMAGARFAAVLSSDVVVEPSVVENAEDVVIYYRQRPAAHITPKGKIKFRSDAYKSLLHTTFDKVLKV